MLLYHHQPIGLLVYVACLLQVLGQMEKECLVELGEIVLRLLRDTQVPMITRAKRVTIVIGINHIPRKEYKDAKIAIITGTISIPPIISGKDFRRTFIKLFIKISP